MVGTGWGGADLLRSQQVSNWCAPPPCLRVLALSFRPASIPSPPGQGPVRPGGQTFGRSWKEQTLPQNSRSCLALSRPQPPSPPFSLSHTSWALRLLTLYPPLWPPDSGAVRTRMEAPPVGSRPRVPRPHHPQPSLHWQELKGGCRSIRGPGTRAVWPGLALPACPWFWRSGERKQHLHLALRTPKLSSGLP